MSALLNHIPGNRFSYEGREYHYFGGTSYLAMQTLPEFRELHARAIREHGTHWGASRGGNVQLTIYEKAEKSLASWAGSPRACTLSSGFLAGRLVLEAFKGPSYRRFYSPNCHSAMLPPEGERYASWSALNEALKAHLQEQNPREAVLFTDTIGFDPKPAPSVGPLRELPCEQLLLVADDSHGFGVLGKDGKGSYRELKRLGCKELVVCGSLGKAMGVTAGAVLAEARRMEELMQHPVFLGASPAPPAAVASLREALNTGLYQRQFDRLTSVVQTFQDRIGGFERLHSLDGYPVHTFQLPELANFLMQRDILITHFQYPAEAGSTSPSRIVLSASHTPADLQRLLSLLNDFHKSQQTR